MQSPPLLHYLVPPRSKYSPQHHVFKHPLLPFLPQCQRPSFTPIQKKWSIIPIIPTDCNWQLYTATDNDLSIQTRGRSIMCSVTVQSLHRQNAKLSVGFTTDKMSFPKVCFQIPHALLTSMLICYRCQAITCWPNNHNTDRNHIQSYTTEFTYIKETVSDTSICGTSSLLLYENRGLFRR